jgi:glycosyltransferase involved in cell wall biosynthesis
VGPSTSISVIVPTRDRPRLLERCLDALVRQEGPALEIVVVDDGSFDAAAVRSVAGKHPRARIVRIERRGPAAARNAGVRAASHEIVLLTDDDCIPDPTWALALATSVKAGGAGAVGGRTVPLPGASAAVRATEVVARHLEERSDFLRTTNLGCRRELLEELPFDESFPAAAGEDREWTTRIRARGLSIAREPSAIVRHAPALDLAAFWRQHVRYGRAACALMQHKTSTFAPPSFYGGLIRSGFRDGPDTGVLVIVAQLATAFGFARERAARQTQGR